MCICLCGLQPIPGDCAEETSPDQTGLQFRTSLALPSYVAGPLPDVSRATFRCAAQLIAVCCYNEKRYLPDLHLAQNSLYTDIVTFRCKARPAL